jgi:hypothetical protein
MPPGNRWGAPVPGRALRGGSWNNNQDNARASARNRNDIDNRNNETGFRVLCAVHVPLRPRMPAYPADHGSPGAAGNPGGWRGCVPTARHSRRAKIPTRGLPGRHTTGSEAPHPCYLALRIQPPSKRPISATIPLTCAYWPLLSQRQWWASRR